jgi:hypothetical protein
MGTDVLMVQILGARPNTVDFVDSESQRANHSLTVLLTQSLSHVVRLHTVANQG